VSGLPVGAKLEEVHRRGVIDLHAVVGGDEPQRVVDVRQMMNGHVMDEGAFHSAIAQAAMQPAQKDKELCEERKSYD
jgi:hypothetical protein